LEAAGTAEMERLAAITADPVVGECGAALP
jgi:hypothetical protein